MTQTFKPAEMAELVGRQVRLTWEDCCAAGTIKGELDAYRHIGGWPDVSYYRINGLGMLVGGGGLEPVDKSDNAGAPVREICCGNIGDECVCDLTCRCDCRQCTCDDETWDRFMDKSDYAGGDRG